MSSLYQVRRGIRELLTEGGLWAEDEVIIKRRTDIWNDVAVACAASARGQCLVVGVAKGRRMGTSGRRGVKTIRLEVTIPITLMELPTIAPEQAEEGEPDEDDRWEATVMRLDGDPLGRSPLHFQLDLEEFEDVEDEEYVIRQTIFKTTLLITPGA
jgi:hypothetical protein